MRHLLWAVAFAVNLGTPLEAQRLQPVGVTRTHADIAPTSYSNTTPRGQLSATGDDTGGIWIWTGIGAVTGAVAGGILAAVDLSHQDDVFFPQIAIVAGVGLGALAGGVLGALTYIGVHNEPQR